MAYSPGAVSLTEAQLLAGASDFTIDVNDGPRRSQVTVARLISGSQATIVADSITGGDASLGITGAAAATATAVGGAIAMAGGAGGATSGAGGPITVIGGAGTAGNSAGGPITFTGGPGQGTAAGGVASLIGGVSGAGATGNGANAVVTGGASGATDGNGGSVVLTGGALAGTGVAGAIIQRGVTVIAQGAPAAATVSAQLTAANILTGIITVNQGGGAASAQQLPLATAMDTAMPYSAAGDAFDFSVINISTVAAEDASVTTAAGWTLVGNMDVASNAAATDKSAGRFRARKTAAGAWTLYRLS
jgi:hypothetical protein